MKEYLSYFTYYHLFGYSIFGLILLLFGSIKKKKLIVEISQVFLIIPLSGLIIYELDVFRDTNAISQRLLVTLSYSLIAILLIVLAKNRVNLKIGIPIAFLFLGILFLVSIAGYTYYKKYFTYDDGKETITISQMNKEKEEAKNYMQFLEIKNFVAESYKDIDEGQSIMVVGEIENTGSRDIYSLSIDVILFGKDKVPIYSETLHVVIEQKPLISRKEIQFKLRLREKPSLWSEGSFTYMIKSMKLAGHHLEYDFKN
jgi:hypothetical protein